MRLRPLPPDPTRSRSRRRLKTIQVLPTLITAGNLVAGVLAISYMLDAAHLSREAAQPLFVRGAWLIFIGMFLDTLDGRIARLTGTTSDFGAQLDSLADVVTFGIAPAMLAKSWLAPAFPLLSSKLIFSFCLVYVLGAALRLARYNVESDRMSRAKVVHVTRVFRGLPSPAAAGVVAAVLLLAHEYAFEASLLLFLEWMLLIGLPLLGLLMISRMPYAHIANRYLDARRAHPVSVVLLILLVYLVVVHFVETVTALFAIYALSGPLLTLTGRVVGRPRWAEHEDEDEETLVAVPDDDDPDDDDPDDDEPDDDEPDDDEPDDDEPDGDDPDRGPEGRPQELP